MMEDQRRQFQRRQQIAVHRSGIYPDLCRRNQGRYKGAVTEDHHIGLWIKGD